MNRNFTLEEIRSAREVYLHNDNLFLVDGDNLAWCFNSATGLWEERTDSFESYWESEMMMCYFKPVGRTEFEELYVNMKKRYLLCYISV